MNRSMIPTRRKSSRRRSNQNANCHNYQSLEVRQMLAFSGFFDGGSSTLTLTQTNDDGIVTINNNGPGGLIQVSDFSGIDNFADATNLTINLLNGNNGLIVELDDAHAGNLELNLGDGQRVVSFLGGDNSIGGDLTINSDFGDQLLTLSQGADLSVAGNVVVDTGFGSDWLSLKNVFSIGGDVELTGLNQVSFDTGFAIAGSFSVDNSAENLLARFEQISGMLSTIDGDFSYVGGSGMDQLELNTIEIGGNVDVDLGSGFTAGADHQVFQLSDFELENLNLLSGNNDNVDQIFVFSGVVNGNASFEPGDGVNQSVITPTVHGNQVSYVGGNNHDGITYGITGPADQNVNINLGDGNDVFVISGTTNTGSLVVDFGSGTSGFLNGTNKLQFDTQLISLDRFNHEYDSDTDTLVSTEIPSAMAGFHSFDTVAANDSAVRVNGKIITATSNLVIDLLEDGVDDLRVSLDADPLAGDLTIDLGSIGNFVGFTGSNNRVAGDVTIVGRDGDHEVRLDTNASLVAGGSLNIDLGNGLDKVLELNNGFVASDVQLQGINDFLNSGTVNVAGDFHADVFEDTKGIIFKNQGSFNSLGNFNIRGGNFFERINFDSLGNASIGGHFNADLADNNALIGQNILFEANTSIAGNVTVQTTSSQIADLFSTEPNSSIGGNVLLDLGHGVNLIGLYHTNGGDSIRIFSGDDGSEVFYGVVGDAANVYGTFGSGHDAFLAEAFTGFDEFLRLDFGGGDTDEFVYHAGDFTQNVSLFDYQGFDMFYTADNNRMKVKQVRDFGNVQVNNSNHLIEVANDNVNLALTPVTDLQVSMQAESSGDLTLDMDQDFAGDLILKLRRGERNVHFTGDSNRFAGDLRIGASEGSQNIHLGVTTDLDVDGILAINLREGFDSVFDNAKEILVGDNLGIRNVDAYEITNKLRVDGDVVVSTLKKNEDARFDNDGELSVAGKFTYIGGTGADEVLLSGNTFIADDVYIDLASNENGGTAQHVSLGDGFEASSRVTVMGATSPGGNLVSSDPTTHIGGDLYVNFSNAASHNIAYLMGQYGGGSGAYRGGSATDDVLFAADAIDMAFSTFLNGGDDELELLAETDLLSMFNDFGEGTDSLIDDTVNVFPMTTVNLP